MLYTTSSLNATIANLSLSTDSSFGVWATNAQGTGAMATFPRVYLRNASAPTDFSFAYLQLSWATSPQLLPPLPLVNFSAGHSLSYNLTAFNFTTQLLFSAQMLDPTLTTSLSLTAPTGVVTSFTSTDPLSRLVLPLSVGLNLVSLLITSPQGVSATLTVRVTQLSTAVVPIPPYSVNVTLYQSGMAARNLGSYTLSGAQNDSLAVAATSSPVNTQFYFSVTNDLSGSELTLVSGGFEQLYLGNNSLTLSYEVPGYVGVTLTVVVWVYVLSGDASIAGVPTVSCYVNGAFQAPILLTWSEDGYSAGINQPQLPPVTDQFVGQVNQSDPTSSFCIAGVVPNAGSLIHGVVSGITFTPYLCSRPLITQTQNLSSSTSATFSLNALYSSAAESQDSEYWGIAITATVVSEDGYDSSAYTIELVTQAGIPNQVQLPCPSLASSHSSSTAASSSSFTASYPQLSSSSPNPTVMQTGGGASSSQAPTVNNALGFPAGTYLVEMLLTAPVGYYETTWLSYLPLLQADIAANLGAHFGVAAVAIQPFVVVTLSASATTGSGRRLLSAATPQSTCGRWATSPRCRSASATRRATV